MTRWRKSAAVFSLVVIGATIALWAVSAWRPRHIAFHEWHAQARLYDLSRVLDHADNMVSLDRPTNSLLVVLGGQGFGMSRGKGPVPIWVGGGRRKTFDHFASDLLVGGTDKELYQFKLPPGAAEPLFIAVGEGRCADIRIELLKLLNSADQEALRAVPGFLADGAASEEAPPPVRP